MMAIASKSWLAGYRVARRSAWLLGAFLIFAQSGTPIFAQSGTVVIDQNGVQDANNLKQIGIALINYANSNNGSLPAEYISDANGTPLLSWRVEILPFLGPSGAALFSQFHLNEAWNSPNNLPLLQQMPDVFRSPLDPVNSTITRYAGGSGPGTMFPCTGVGSCTGLRFPASITDGTSNTLFVGETEGSNIPWTEPIDIPIGANPTLGGNGFSSFVLGAVPFVFADGSVGFLPDNIDSNTLHALFTPDGGEFVDTSALLDSVIVAPGPIAGAGLPGLILAGCGLLAWWRRKRKALAPV